jgi:HEPN domain-containing protein
MGAVVWGHSVADLLEELAQRQEVPEDIRDAALELDKAYIPVATLTRIPLALHGVAIFV